MGKSGLSRARGRSVMSALVEKITGLFGRRTLHQSGLRAWCRAGSSLEHDRVRERHGSDGESNRASWLANGHQENPEYKGRKEIGLPMPVAFF